MLQSLISLLILLLQSMHPSTQLLSSNNLLKQVREIFQVNLS